MAKRQASHRAVGVQRTHVRQLRRESTWPERRLWALLRNRRLGGAKFRRQQPIGPFIVDYFCASARLVIELDGESHVGRGMADQQRDQVLQGQGLRVLRITNDDVLATPDAVLEAILQLVNEHSTRG